MCNRRWDQQIDCKGVISEHDLIVAQASNPGVLIKEIKRAQTSKELKQIRVRLTDLIKLPFIKIFL
jgi:CBS domain-containing protein